jgi:hypothetical protein
MSDNPQSDAIQYLAVLLARETKRADQLEVEQVSIKQAAEQQALALAHAQRDYEIAAAHRDQWQNDARRQEQRADGLASEVAALRSEMKGAIEDFLHDVTRFEVIDHRSTTRPDPGSPDVMAGRVFHTMDASISMDFQDGHRTLKVFVNDREYKRTLAPERPSSQQVPDHLLERLRGSE